MKANATVSNAKPHSQRYIKATDGRKQPIRGLWCRGDKFYARIVVEDSSGKKTVKRVPLAAVTTSKAIEELHKLTIERAENRLRHIGMSPKFADYADQTYLPRITGAKKPRTVEKEQGCLRKWKSAVGHIRLDKIRPCHITAFQDGLKDAGMTNRTRNIYLVVLRNVLKSALTDGFLATLPTNGIAWLKTETKERALATADDLNRLCERALAVSKNGREFADYVRLLAFCGARRDEGLSLKWGNVDWESKQLVIGSAGDTKNRESRRVDFNPDLEKHLRDMAGRRQPDSEWMFPSPQRGDKDAPAKTFRESLTMARAAAEMPRFGFHDCRHYFISHCVMSGLDYMTIAKWVGHKDGGILIGKVYGHLAAEHTKAQAQRIVFGPRVHENTGEEVSASNV